MKTREQVLETLAQNKAGLMRRFKLRRIALFGSYARNQQGPGSDVDILVDVDPSIGLDFVVLADTAEDLLGLPAHVVSTRAVSPENMKEISRDLTDVQAIQSRSRLLCC